MLLTGRPGCGIDQRSAANGTRAHYRDRTGNVHHWHKAPNSLIDQITRPAGFLVQNCWESCRPKNDRRYPALSMSAPRQIEFGMLLRIPDFDLSEEGSTQHNPAVVAPVICNEVN
jgi:hypothetical protein